MNIQQDSQFCLVVSTAPDIATARGLAAAVLERKLAACVNLLPGVESHYWWQGKVENAQEVLLLMKTTRGLCDSLLSALPQFHPYEVPEAIVLPIESGLPAYLEWIFTSTQQRSQ
jgi:periplasmic divalent cation tolerance protein